MAMQSVISGSIDARPRRGKVTEEGRNIKMWKKLRIAKRDRTATMLMFHRIYEPSVHNGQTLCLPGA